METKTNIMTTKMAEKQDYDLIKVINNKQAEPNERYSAKKELEIRGHQITTINKEYLLMAEKLKKNNLKYDEIEKELCKNGLNSFEAESVTNKVKLFKSFKFYGILSIITGIIFTTWGLLVILINSAHDLNQGTKAFGVGGLVGGGVILLILSFTKYKIHKSFSKIIIYSYK